MPCRSAYEPEYASSIAVLALSSRCQPTRQRCTRECTRSEFSAVKPLPSMLSAPSSFPGTSSYRLPVERIGKGSASGRIPFLGSPSAKVRPKSLLSGLLVVTLKPSWLGVQSRAFSVS